MKGERRELRRKVRQLFDQAVVDEGKQITDEAALQAHISSTLNVHGIADTSKLVTLDTPQTISAQKTFFGAGNTGVIFDCTSASGSAWKLKMNAPPNANWTFDARLTSAGTFETGAWITVSGTKSATPDSEGWNPIGQPTLDPYMCGLDADVYGPSLVTRALGTGLGGSNYAAMNDDLAKYVYAVDDSGRIWFGQSSTVAGLDCKIERTAALSLHTNCNLSIDGRTDLNGNASGRLFYDGNLVTRLDFTFGSGQTGLPNFGIWTQRRAQAYSASITIDATTGNSFAIGVSNATPFTVNAPTSPVTGQRIVVMVKNQSGGAMGAITWNAVFKMAAWTNPANGFNRSIEFEYDGVNWIEINRTPADVPN